MKPFYFIALLVTSFFFQSCIIDIDDDDDENWNQIDWREEDLSGVWRSEMPYQHPQAYINGQEVRAFFLALENNHDYIIRIEVYDDWFNSYERFTVERGHWFVDKDDYINLLPYNCAGQINDIHNIQMNEGNCQTPFIFNRLKVDLSHQSSHWRYWDYRYAGKDYRMEKN